MSTDVVDIAYEKAIESLKMCRHPLGIRAAAKYYPDVWTRDGVISSFGALLLRDEEFDESVRNSLGTMKDSMNDIGHVRNWIPTNREITGALGGAIDSNLWYIIGLWYYWKQRGDDGVIAEHLESLEKAVLWLRYQDSNDDGLLESHESYDWADLYPNRYHVLLDNILYMKALHCAADLLEAKGQAAERHRHRGDNVKRLLRLAFWLDGDIKDLERRLDELKEEGELLYIYKQMHGLYWSREFFFAYLPFRQMPHPRFDTLGNMCAILMGLASKRQTGLILDYTHSRGINIPFPCKAHHPVIAPGNPDWRDYLYNREYCVPHSGHNGGIWPFVGGFYVAALAAAGRGDEAREQLANLAEANRIGKTEWEFNELIHGESGRPIGAINQAWSAAMYIYAYRAVHDGKNFLAG